MCGLIKEVLWVSVLVLCVVVRHGVVAAPSSLVSTLQQPQAAKPTVTTRENGLPASTPDAALNQSENNGGAENLSDANSTKNTNPTLTITTAMYSESTYEGSDPSKPEMAIVVDYKNVTSHNTSDGQNATMSEDQPNEGTHLNLAIIPALGVLFLLIVGCLKCCKCFRRYTRGGDKDENMIGTDYAVIVQDGEEEFDYVDIKSDTASNACYDTVSSYCSFLKRSNNSNSMTPVRQFNLDNTRINSPRKEVMHRSTSSKEGTPILSRQTSETEVPSETCDSVSPRSDSVISEYLRTVSVSSEEIEPLSASASESINRSQRSKVSFVTGNSELPKRSYSVHERMTNRPLSMAGIPKKPSLRKLALTTCSQQHSTGSIIQFPDNVLTSSSKKPSSANKGHVHVVMVTVATQTARSFIYKMSRETRRHFSESCVDGTPVPSTVKETNSPCLCSETCDNKCKSIQVDQNKSNLSSKCLTSGSQNIGNATVAHFVSCDKTKRDAKLVRTQRSGSETDSTDDVFLNNEDSADKLQEEVFRSDCDNSVKMSTQNKKNSEQLSKFVKTSDGVTRVIKNSELLPCRCQSDLLSRIGCNPAFENEKINRHSCVARIISHGYENDRLDSAQVTCSCNNTSRGKRVASGIKTNVPYSECQLAPVNYSLPCLRCGGYNVCQVSLSNTTLKQVNSSYNKIMPRLERETSLVSEELTSSTTSLESSGYAEISSEASN